MKTALSIVFVLATAMLLAVSLGALDRATAQGGGPARGQTFMRPAPAFAPLLPAPARVVQLHEGARPATAEAVALLANTTILSDDFEGPFPGAWQLYYSTGTESTTLWGKSSYRAAGGSHSVWCAGGGTSPQSPGSAYVPNMGVWLEYGPFDLSDATAATVDFDLWSNVDAGTGNSYPDRIGLYVSTDDFNSNGSGFYYSNTGQTWQHKTFNFSDVTSVPSIGAHQVYIAFIFSSDSSIQYEGSYIDNVVITKTTAGPTCSLACGATVPATAQLNESVSFQGSATPAGCSGSVAYDWNFGDGSAHSNQANPFHAYPAAGAYNWQLTSTIAGVTCTKNGSITIAAAPSSTISYWLPVVSHKSGLYQSQWRSDLGVLNAGAATANLSVRWYVGGNVLTGTATVAPGVQAIFQDVVGPPAFNYSDSGALEVVSDQPVYVTSRTYNQADATHTFGQDYNSFTPAQGYSTGQVFYLPQLTENAAYRTNIGVTNIGSATAVVTVALYSGAGTKLYEFPPLSLAPGQFHQETQPFMTWAGQTNMTKGYAKITVTQGSGVIAYASVIDNNTNDPTTIPMKQAIVGPTDYWLPVVSHKSGLYQSQWRSDLGVLNIGSATANLSLRWYVGGNVLTGTATVAPGAQAIFQDVVGPPAFNYSDSGALEVVSDQPVYVTSRTYNQADATHTFGQDYNSFTSAQAYSTGQVLYLPQLTENAGYRTNIGVTNIGSATAIVTVALYSGAGTKLYEFPPLSLAPGQFHQETQPFMTWAGQTNMTSGYAKITVTQGSAVVAYASVIDNNTNDPTTIPMKRGVGSGVIDPLASATWIYTSVLGQLGVKVPTLDSIVSSVVSSGPGPLTSQLIAPDPVHRIPLSNGVRFDYGAGTMVRSAWVTGSATVTYSNANNTSNGFSANYAISTSSDFAVNGAKYPITSITGTVSATQSTTSGGTALEEGVSRVFAGVSRLFGMVPSGTKTVADLTVNGTGSNPAATESGGVHFDTSVCRNYPVSGSIIRTIGSDRYVFNFTNKCDSSFGYAANPPALSCNAGQQVAGGDTPDSRFFEMGRTSATFRFDYDTQSIPDRIQILYQGAVIFDSTCLGTNGTITAHPSFSGSSSLIQVNVTPNCSGGTSGTAWSYQVYCP